MKILIIQTAFPGDAILTLPLLQKLASKYPQAVIDIICIPSTEIIFKNSSSVNYVIVYDKKNKQRGIGGLITVISDVRKRNYNTVYSPHRSTRSALIAYFSRAKERVSFDKSSLKFLYTKTVRYDESHHEVQRNLSLIGESSWEILPELQIESNIQVKVDELISELHKTKMIAIAPGSIWNTKEYPVDFYKKIAFELVEKGYQILLLGSRDDSARADEISSSNANAIINFCGELNFIESLYMLKKCELIICNDSAPTHLGVCADIPVLTIYCSTVPEFGFYPYHSKGKYLSYGDLDCKPCGIHGHKKCPEGHFECGWKLNPETVLNQVEEMLQERHSL